MTRTTDESIRPFPYEIAEMIIAHLAHNLDALKAFSLTCRSWYIVAVPHLHHSLTLAKRTPGFVRGRVVPPSTHKKLESLPELHKLGLMPLVEEIRVEQYPGANGWFVPRAFSRRNLHYFSAFANVRTLKLEKLEIYHFIPGIERYFGHFSPTLRSITLAEPQCTPRQLSYFLSLFANLDDIRIWRIFTNVPNTTVPETELDQLSAPKLHGQLVLRDFRSVETWRHLIASCGGLRFRYMDLGRDTACAPVLVGACAETLETLRLYLNGGLASRQSSVCLRIRSDDEQEANSIYRGSKSFDIYKFGLG